MKRSLFSKFVKTITAVFCIAFVLVFFGACSFGETESTYSISGYVYDEYGAVEGVNIKCELGTFSTDKDGKYTISGIKTSVLLEPSCEGYQFEQSSKLITSANDNANFSASKEYVVSGYVKNNDSMIVGAYVTINSLSGKFITTTDETGYFEGKNVAGKTTVSCKVDGVEFFSQTATIDNNSVSINLTSSFTINLEFDSEDIDYSAISLKIGENEYSLTGASTSFDEVYCGTVVELSSTKYLFSKPQFYISTLNQTENIQVSKIYSVSGYVKSGNVSLAGASIFVDGVAMATTDQNGWYEIDNLTSIHNITAKYDSLNFNLQVVNNLITTADFNGTKSVYFAFNFDNKTNGEISFGNFAPETSNGTEFTFNSVCLGDQISVNSDSYHFDTNLIEISDRDLYSISANAYYAVDFNIENFEEEALNDVQILLDGQSANLSDLQSLYSTHTISAVYKNYVFSECNVNATNTHANLTYKIPYDAKILVSSGDILLSDAKVQIGEAEYVANELGEISLPQIVGNIAIKVSCNGYNTQIIELFENEANDFLAEKSINLTYNISGKVTTGEKPVANAKVCADFDNKQSECLTNSLGEYLIEGLYGSAKILVEKEHFTFVEQNTAIGALLNFDGVYKVFGYLTTTDELGNEIPYNNIEVVLLSQDGIFAFVTIEDGYFEFNDIRGECSFSTKKEGSAEHAGLRPSEYKVSVGGEYNFNNNGYSISGTILSGGLPVVGVYVQAGSNGTFTDDNGNYSFALITGSCEIVPQKEGYDFGSKIVVTEERDDVDFEATYTVQGTVISGLNAICDVSVKYQNSVIAVTNQSGEFVASGLSGNCELVFEKDGYQFDSLLSVSKPMSATVECKVVATIKIKTGNIFVSDFLAFSGGKEFVSENDFVTVYVASGETVRLEKQGYIIESVVVETPETYIASATYSIGGFVRSGDVPISNVAIKYNGNIYYSDNLGRFEIFGLVGECEISFEKIGYNFELLKVTSASSKISVSATYTISGRVLLVTSALEGVKVSCGDLVTYTDNNGYFSFENISGKFDLICEKLGYTFAEIADAFGSAEISVAAYYTVSGYIKSGNLAVAGANIELSISNSSKRLYAVSDENGYFEIVGVSGTSSLLISKDGYNTTTISDIYDYTSNISANLSYSYTLVFDGTGKTNVTVFVGDQKFVTTSNTIKLQELFGEVSLRFERANTAFNPKTLTIKEPGTITISTTVSYNIHGTVKAEGGYALAGVNVVVGSSTAKTDKNGYFEFNGVAGNIQISNEFLSTYNTPISKDGEYNITVRSNEFAYLLYANADKNIRTSSSAQITGTGSVIGDAGITKTTQYVHAIYKRDNLGNILRQNLNYGDAVFGIDPKVSMIAYYSASANKWYYDQVEDGNVTNKTTANHTVSGLKEVSESGFANIYGNPPNNYLPYSISQQTATMSAISINSNGNYVFTMTLSTNQTGYGKQVVALSGVTFKGFDYISMTCEIDKNGWFVTISTSEKYKIQQGVSVSITSNINYNFLTRSNNLKIDNINMTSDVAIQSSLRISEQTALYNLPNLVYNKKVSAINYKGRRQTNEKF